MTTLVAVLGSVTAPGRLRSALEYALSVATVGDDTPTAELLDLAEHRISFADGRPLADYPDDTARAVEYLMRAESVLIATPVYRAGPTGALKNLLDLAPVEALQGKPTGIVAMGATLHHYLGADWQLRMLLSWFGALTAPTSVYLESNQFAEGRLADTTAMEQLQRLVATLKRLNQVPASALGPSPLAASRP